ncbi:hypothetical protein JHK84_047866 [Glycine max]|nr:hypothetical protein JHK85_048455 [Glycine max]KAG5102897.1 hypothetical protein JHK84_047866 [Glycine max]
MILCILREKDSFGLEEHSGIDLSGNTDPEHDISNNTQGSSEGVEHQTSSVGDIHRTHVNESIGDIQKNASKKQVESPNKNIEAEDVKEISHVVFKETGKASEVEGSNAAKTKNKSMLPTSKASPISTPKSSKPASKTPNKTVTPASSTRKGSSPSLTMRQITSVEDKSMIKKQVIG